jgi:hypothetical protein
MNGTQFMRPKFSAPASHNTSQMTWDLAFLTKRQFIAKHGEALYDYTKDPSGSAKSDSKIVDQTAV